MTKTTAYDYCKHCGSYTNDAWHLCPPAIHAATTIVDSDAPCVTTAAGMYEMSHGIHDAVAWYRSKGYVLEQPYNPDDVIRALRSYRYTEMYDEAVEEFDNEFIW